MVYFQEFPNYLDLLNEDLDYYKYHFYLQYDTKKTDYHKIVMMIKF